jgi:hypothetical protein
MVWVLLLSLFLATPVSAQQTIVINPKQTILDWNDIRLLEDGSPVPKNEAVFYRVWIGPTASSLQVRALAKKSFIPIKSLLLTDKDKWIAFEAYSSRRVGMRTPVLKLIPPKAPRIIK